MSLQKISVLLSQGHVIDANLMTEQLNATLKEISNLIISQDLEIKQLKELVTKFASKEDLESLKEQCNASITQLQKEVDENQMCTDERIDTLSKDVVSKNDAHKKEIDSFRDQIRQILDTQEQATKGQFFIINQQIKDLHAEQAKEKETTNKNSQKIAKIEAKLNSSKDDSIELLGYRVNQLESSITTRIDNNNSAMHHLEEIVTEMKKLQDAFQVDANNELHVIHVEMEEIRHIVVDIPQIELNEGVLDTEAVVRAIQRDSRRIDNFNETMMAIKDEHLELRDLITNLAHGFDQMQMGVHDFIIDYNQTRRQTNQRFEEDENYAKTISSKMRQLVRNHQSIAEASLNGMTFLSSTIQLLTSYLAKISTRAVPPLPSLDDVLLEFQRLIDMFSQQEDSMDRSTALSHSNSAQQVETMVQKEFEMPFINVTVPEPSAKLRKHNRIYVSDDDEKVEPPPVAYQSAANISLETRHSILELESKVEELSSTVNQNKDLFETKLERKADVISMERMIEKLRSTIATVRNSLNQTNAKINDHLSEPEVKRIVREMLMDSDVNDRSPLKVMNQAHSINQTPSSQRAMEVIYGAQSSRRSNPLPALSPK